MKERGGGDPNCYEIFNKEIVAYISFDKIIND